MTIRHFVLTRHAIAHKGSPPSADWVRARRALLSAVTANSLKHQSSQAFEWLVFVDVSLAEGEADYLAQQVGGTLNWRVVAVSSEEVQDGNAFWGRALGAFRDTDRLVTTRVDSDDAVHPEFIETVAKIAAGVAAPTSVDLVRGAYVDSTVGIPLTRPYRASPFQSLVEVVSASSPLQTVMAHPHPDLPQFFTYLPVDTRYPMWFVSVHGGNIANRAYGRPRPAAVVPLHLRAPLGVRDSTRFEQWRYGLQVAKEYSARFTKPTSVLPAARTLAGHLGTLGQGGRNSTGELKDRS